jgi:hypothetical protein
VIARRVRLPAGGVGSYTRRKQEDRVKSEARTVIVAGQSVDCTDNNARRLSPLLARHR